MSCYQHNNCSARRKANTLSAECCVFCCDASGTRKDCVGSVNVNKNSKTLSTFSSRSVHSVDILQSSNRTNSTCLYRRQYVSTFIPYTALSAGILGIEIVWDWILTQQMWLYMERQTIINIHDLISVHYPYTVLVRWSHEMPRGVPPSFAVQDSPKYHRWDRSAQKGSGWCPKGEIDHGASNFGNEGRGTAGISG